MHVKAIGDDQIEGTQIKKMTVAEIDECLKINLSYSELEYKNNLKNGTAVEIAEELKPIETEGWKTFWTYNKNTESTLDQHRDAREKCKDAQQMLRFMKMGLN